jgi:hypothetical protein
MHELPDRFGPAWGLVMLVAAVAAVLLLGRVLGRRGAPSNAPAPSPAAGDPDDAPAPCAIRGCSTPATRGRPELVQRRPLAALLPAWVVVDDPDADPALCRAHHGVWTAALAQLIAEARAATEAHLAVQHRELVARAAVDVPKLLGYVAPAPPRPAPSPLRAPTVPPINGVAVDLAAVAAAPAETPDGPPS